ncbi:MULTISPECIES: HlyD family type I secretion periplasmic adaptor subunit [unclassified Caballeronia]|uniref:HlyD family type I secretion periplasmic adaptor subunit n=1 Tax=unclassified Caballeronia TaxID=2646786 RepID=UPI002028EE66|nr:MULTISPECIES: HlyD family type I secretion periplasmic adaptor subunit [unclassified Caballeronia]
MSVRHRFQAFGDLIGRYVSIFSYSWKNRHALRTDFFNKQEAEFLPAGLSLQEAPGSSTLRWTGRILMAMVAFALLWSIFGHIDIVVSATGKVIPSARTKTIGSVDVASVRALYVTEGQEVHAGDVLIELDSSSSDAERDKAVDAVAQAKLQLARSQAMTQAVEQLKAPKLRPITGVTTAQWDAARSQLDGQYRDFHAKLARLDGEVARYVSALPLAAQRAEDFKALVPDHTVSQHAWLEKEQARVELQGQLTEARNQRAALLAQTRKEAEDAIFEANKIIAAGEQDERRAGEHSKLLKLTAPVDGTVQQLTVHTVGGVVPAAQPLMQIVPKESVVEIEAFLENKDVGFVHNGQEAEVKIDAFDYTKYGTIPARVRHVSQDAIEDEKKGLIYATKITLDRNSIFVDGKTLPLSAGMSINAEIKTGTRRVIEYVLSPLVRHEREALRER